MTALTDPVPLRQNLAWGTFANGNAAHIPHRYGEVGGALIQYDKQRLNFVWADHPVESIDVVMIDGVPAQGWTWANVLDVTGHTVAMVTMQQPVDLSANVTARGKGKLHPRTGARMTDPAAILWDVLTNIAGRDLTESSLGAFSAACAARGLEACGSIESPDPALAIAKAICDSVGAIFAPATPGLAVLWPGVPALSVATIDSGPDGKVTAQVTAGVTDIANDLTIRYAFESDSPRQSLQLDAPDSVARFGRRAISLDARWISSPRVAFDVAKRLLEQQARPQWKVHVSGIDRRVKVGQAVTMAHPAAPVSGDHVVTASELTFAAGKTAIDISAAAGSVPVVRIVQQSEAFDPQSYAAVTVSTQAGNRVFHFNNADGTPMVGASVVLPSANIERFTDAGGNVAFPVADMPAGSYTLHVTPANGDEFDAPVIVT